ncbi:MAG: helix-turn-helix domain-containing protein [Lachnospiraceae bacterium]
MKSFEQLISSKSEYYIYTPSATAKKLFLYPIHIGYFYYEPYYYQKRDHFDSFLLMLITGGSCSVKVGGTFINARKGDLVLLDCYAPHQYRSNIGWQALWIHFDGTMARRFYDHILDLHGNIITPKDYQNMNFQFERLCSVFRNGVPIKESVLSKYITTILSDLLFTDSISYSRTSSEAIDETLSYISEHFKEDISLDSLAEMASLSQFYFTRLFAKETGMTPHQYLIATRISYAKYMLKSTSVSIKEIAFDSGFTSESGFCSTFKKWEHITPSQYRSSGDF